MHHEASAAGGDHFLGELANVLSRRPGMNNIRAAAIGEGHSFFCLGESNSAKSNRFVISEGPHIMRYRHATAVPRGRKFVGECRYVQRAIGGETAVEYKKNIERLTRFNGRLRLHPPRITGELNPRGG